MQSLIAETISLSTRVYLRFLVWIATGALKSARWMLLPLGGLLVIASVVSLLFYGVAMLWVGPVAIIGLIQSFVVGAIGSFLCFLSSASLLARIKARLQADAATEAAEAEQGRRASDSQPPLLLPPASR